MNARRAESRDGKVSFLFALISALLIGACSSAPVSNALDSPESLARAVLDAMERRDVDALQRLALSREEFISAIWPQLPAARPERNLSADYVWGDLNQKSNLTLRQTLAAHGGRRYRVKRVRFLGDSSVYDTYLVHRESELAVVDSEGVERTIRLFGSVVEQGGRFKVFSYVVAD